MADTVKMIGVRFKQACKVYDFDSSGLELRSGDMVIVEVEKGLGIGAVAYGPKEMEPSAYPRKLKRVLRKADTVDMERHVFNTERENEALRICREKIVRYRLPMKLVRVEYLFDSSKAVFYFTSDIRVDFRELVKDLAAAFHTRIEMRQIGVRDEAKMLGGIGPCGRGLCCTSFLSDFAPVTIKMAKEQNLALNPAKISGICGRLMCCLGYEHGMYSGKGGCERKNGGGIPSGQGVPSGQGGQGAAPQEKARE
ncbi:MAG: stage 0 sporulation family protein [Deltaproteobacteria bacterium]|nr:stage 0 sporulation family protein [Deltaproteobacteria bacterium]